MDHLPSPRNPSYVLKEIPYLAGVLQADELINSVDISFASDDEHSKFLQEGTKEEYVHSLATFQFHCFVEFYLLFFGVFGIPVVVDDIMTRTRKDADGQGITTRSLPRQLALLEAKVRQEYDNNCDDEHEAQFEKADELLTTVNNFLDTLPMQSIRENERSLWPDSVGEDLLFDRIHMSVILLGQALTTGINFLNMYPLAWVHGPWLHEKMMAAGWCRSETFSLFEQYRGDPASIFYFSQFDRRSLRRIDEHRKCTDTFRCNRENLDRNTYRTKHCAECSEVECEMVTSDTIDMPVVSDIVLRGNTPLVLWHGGKENSRKMEIIETQGQDVPYVCISHVWSEPTVFECILTHADSYVSGLGNLSSNAIPQCQVQRLNRLVQDLYGPSSGPVPFWLDTLCVPLQHPARRKAIETMRHVYTNAAKVLVLDSVMTQVSVAESDVTELAARIRISTWGRRLWTFHEACLAKTLFYQFGDRAIDLADLKTKQATQCAVIRADSPSSTGHSSESPDWYINGQLSSINPILEGCLIWIGRQASAVNDEQHSHWGLVTLLSCLRFRWTSWLEDETICLAGILGGNIISEVLKYTTREDRMRVFLSTFSSLPSDIMYVIRPRSTQVGFRWMPLTFLGESAESSPQEQPGHATLTNEGLSLRCEGFLLQDTVLLGGLWGIKTATIGGKPYVIQPVSDVDLRDYAGRDLAVMLRTALVWADTPAPGQIHGYSKGILTTVNEHRDGVLVVGYVGIVDVLRGDGKGSRTVEGQNSELSLDATLLPRTQHWVVT